MYHDQGHIPSKFAGFDDTVNVTLGLPIVRTSVDHGTAYDIAGTGKANEANLLAAIELAAQMATQPRAQLDMRARRHLLGQVLDLDGLDRVGEREAEDARVEVELGFERRWMVSALRKPCCSPSKAR